jgi:exosortase/archaeosortase family protein
MQNRSLQSIITKSSAYFDITFFAKLIFLFLAFYFFNIFFLGITTADGRFYSSFLEHNLNYISWLTSSILYVANAIDHLFGVNSFVQNAYNIKTYSGASVTVWLPCLGLGVMSFWVAFIIADANNWKKKLYWIVIGIVAIWFVNCLRISLLLLALEKNWYQSTYIDHHTIFNIATYIVILFMIWLYLRKSKKEMNADLSVNRNSLSSVTY